MSTAKKEYKKVTTNSLFEMKQRGERIAMLTAYDYSGDEVTLVHADDPQLRRMAVFDVILNNADRKGGHILTGVDGGVYGVEHGVSLHVHDKLRTVLWQWRGAQIPAPLIADLKRWLDLVSAGGPGVAVLHELLSEEEVEVLVERGNRLVAEARHPQPSPDWPAIPWPPF